MVAPTNRRLVTEAHPLVADTGLRDVRSLLVNGAVPGGGPAPTGGSEPSHLVRVGRMVTLRLSWAQPAMTAGTEILRIPAGFRYATSLYLPPTYANQGSLVLASDGRLLSYITGASPGIRALWTWYTPDPWPTTLPGSPA